MEKYEIVDTISGERFEFLGISSSQVDAFVYIVKGKNSANDTFRTVHISHINKDCLLIYDKKYKLTDDDAVYFYNDLKEKGEIICEN